MSITVTLELTTHIERYAPQVAPLLKGIFAIHADIIATTQPTMEACVEHYERQVKSLQTAMQRQPRATQEQQPRQGK